MVAVFHGGTPEDTALAHAVPGIDAIVSGHTHERYHRSVVRENSIPTTHVWQCGSHGETLGVLDFEFDFVAGLILIPAETFTAQAAAPTTPAAGSPAPHCFLVDRFSSDSDGVVAAQIHKWRAEAGDVLGGVDTQRPVYNGESGLLFWPGMPQNEASLVVARCVLDELNHQLAGGGEGGEGGEGGDRTQPLANISPMLNSAAASVAAAAETGATAGTTPPSTLPLRHRLSAYVSCKVCVESDFNAVDGTIPLLVSDAMRLLGITGARHVVFLYFRIPISNQLLSKQCPSTRARLHIHM